MTRAELNRAFVRVTKALAPLVLKLEKLTDAADTEACNEDEAGRDPDKWETARENLMDLWMQVEEVAKFKSADLWKV